MPRSFDLPPTEPLRGVHLVGTVARRFLISYPVPPKSLEPFLPPGAELSTWGGSGWVSACYVRMQRLRPSFGPRPIGFNFNYLIHRTRAKLPFPDGQMREAVLILEPNLDSRLATCAARLSTGVPFRRRRIELTESPDVWRLTMHDRGQTLLDVEIPQGSLSPTTPVGSLFRDGAAADQFLLGVSYGGWWNQASRSLSLLAETHEPWETTIGSCRTRANVLVESLCGRSVEADHAITMTNVPHYFAAASTRVELAAESRLAPENAGLRVSSEKEDSPIWNDGVGTSTARSICS
jgi:uncharacterized protein YqjF (DUF2071 family)